MTHETTQTEDFNISDEPMPATKISNIDGSPFPLLITLGIASIGAYIIGHLGWSMLWIVIFLFLSYFTIKRRIDRLRVYHRHAVERAAMRNKLDKHIESTEWLNLMMERVWIVLEPNLSVTITEKVNGVLDKACPSFLDSLELSEFTLGSSAPIILGAKVHPQTDLNIIHLDLELCFVPCEDTTSEDFRPGRYTSSVNQWNSKIVLVARIGRGILGMDVPVMLKELMIFCNARVQVELTPTIPYISKLQLSFLELPKIDFILRPLKSVDLMDLPGLSTWMMSTLNEIMEKKVVDPNILEIPISKRRSEVSSIGVLKVSLFQMRGIKHRGNFMETFVRMQIAGRIKAISQKATPGKPEWNEVFYILLNSLKSPLVFVVLASDKSVIGSTTLSISEIESDTGHLTDVWRTIVSHESSKIRGELHFGAEFFPITETPDPEADLNFESGIVQISLHQVKDICPPDKKALNCCYEIYIYPTSEPLDMENLPVKPAEGSFYRSKTQKRSLHPSWDEVFEVFLERKDIVSICIILRHGTKEDVIYASWNSEFNCLLNRTDWFTLSLPEKAQFYASFIFRPVRIDLTSAAKMNFTPAIGVVRITIGSASGLKNSKDGYHVKVTLKNRLVGKTGVSLPEIAPVWNKSMYGLLVGEGEILSLELFQNGKNAPLGTTQVSVSSAVNHPKHDIDFNEELKEFKEGKTIGRIRFSLGFYTREPENTSNELTDEYPIVDVQQLEQLSNSNSGILQIRSISISDMEPGGLHSLTYIQLNVNSIVDYKTQPMRLGIEGVTTWEYLKEFIISEPHNQEVNFHVKQTHGTNDDIISELKLSLLSLKCGTIYKLPGMERGNIEFHMRYFPIDLEVEPEPEDAGILQIKLISARDLIAVDSGGTSDPFAVLRLNGNKFYKSQVHKKCLNPKFDESTSTPIRQKNVSTLQIELRDWNMVAASRTLGLVNIDLQNLHPSEWQELDLPLENVSSGNIKISLQFVPKEKGYNKIKEKPKSMENSGVEERLEEKDVVSIVNNEKVKMAIAETTNKVSKLRASISQNTAAGLKITICELTDCQLHGDLKVKIRQDGHTIFKTRSIKDKPYRWNESFTLPPDISSTITLIVKDKEFALDMALVAQELEQREGGETQMKLVSGDAKLRVNCAFTTDSANLIDSSYRRKSFFRRISQSGA